MDFISNTKLIKDPFGAYDFFDLYLMQGKVPWYITYEDLIDIFSNFKKYTGMKATENMLVVEILTAITTRWRKDLQIFPNLAKSFLTYVSGK